MPTDPTFDEVSPEVAALLAAARATTPVTPDPSLTSLMAAAVDTGSLGTATTTPRRKTLIGKLITAKALAVVGALALTGGVAAAATGTLPDPIQDTAANVADVVGVDIPKSNHGADVSDVARDKSGDSEDSNHGATVSDTARDNHGHNKDGEDDTTSTSTTVVGGSKHDDGPGNNGQGNANGHSKHDGSDDPADHDSNDDNGDDSTTSTTVGTGTTPTTVDDHGGSKNSGKGKNTDKTEDSGSHKSNDD